MPILPMAHPLYCPSDLLQHLTDNSCRSDGHIFLPIPPIQQLLSCLQGSRVEIINCSCRTATQFCRSDGHFLQSYGHFSQVGWVFFVGRMGTFVGRTYEKGPSDLLKCPSDSLKQVGCTNTLFLTCPSDLQLLQVRCCSRSDGQYSGWAIGRMGIRADQHYPYIFCTLGIDINTPNRIKDILYYSYISYLLFSRYRNKYSQL